MSSAHERFQLFNVETMSGVFPGTRTARYQRLRLEPLAGGDPCWAQLLWYDEPPSCVLVRQDAVTSQLEGTPLLRIPEPHEGEFRARLEAALAAAGWRLRACGSCAHWQESASRGMDDLAVGRCRLRRAGDDQTASVHENRSVLAAQSLVALECAAWRQVEAQAAHTAEPKLPLLPVAPLPRIAVITESKLKPWQRWVRKLQRRVKPPTDPSLSSALAERSGVGAGTEPCLACHGRIANLGALTVETPDEDKQTFSVWRCRLCATLYLSDWIDRWERVDSLETEETLYRIAPVEAGELLALFATIPAGDHPQGRQARGPQREWILGQMQGRAPVSHIIKQGR